MSIKSESALPEKIAVEEVLNSLDPKIINKIDISIEQMIKEEETSSANKPGFIDRNLNKFRVAAAALGLFAAAETKAFDAAKTREDRITQNDRNRIDEMHDQSMNELNSMHKKFQETKIDEQKKVEDYKNAAVARLDKEFPGVGVRVDKIFIELLEDYQNSPIETKLQIIDELEKTGRERLSAKKVDKKIQEQKVESGKMHSLSKFYEDGVDLEVKYMISKKGEDSRIIFDGKLRMFSVDKYFKPGHNWGSLKGKYKDTSLSRTDASMDATNL